MGGGAGIAQKKYKIAKTRKLSDAKNIPPPDKRKYCAMFVYISGGGRTGEKKGFLKKKVKKYFVRVKGFKNPFFSPVRPPPLM